MATAPGKHTPLFGGDVFNQVVALLMTLIIIQSAVITFWFTMADDSNGDAGRDAQILALEGLGKRTIGSIQSNYDETGAYQRWVELDTLAKLADYKTDTLSAQRLRAARDRITKLSPLLQAPYFDAGTGAAPNYKQYQADTFLIEAIRLSEQFENQARLKEQWSDRASAYTVMLTLLAVTLFLMGISTNSSRRLRMLFFIVGLVLAVGVLGWMLVTHTRPITGYSDEAIEAYAQGVGKLYQGQYAAAETDLDRAIAAADTYTNAYRDRAVAKFYAGDYAGAAADFESAIANRDVTSETASSLGYVYYLLGKFDAAAPLHDKAVEQSPDEVWTNASKGLNLLAADEIPAGENAYKAMFDALTRSVSETRAGGKQPPAGLWYDFDTAANELDALAQCAATKVCETAPPYTALKNPSDIAAAAAALAVRLREYAVALEYTSQPPPALTNVEVDPFTFARELSDKNELLNPTDTFTATDEPIYLASKVRNLHDAAKLVIKVFVNGTEDDRLRVTQTYDAQTMGGPDGDIFLEITTGGVPLAAGKYHVEMYVDSKLVQTGNFQVVGE